MNNIKPLSKRHLHHLQEIIKAKTGDRGVYLLKNKSQLEGYFGDYEKEFDANTLETLTATKLKTLKGKMAKHSLHCYNRSTGALKALKDEIIENQSPHRSEFCPYCGIGDGAQFDHYVPKQKFPEYAVHALNLLPCCSTCNGKKSETWLVNGARVFVNLYTDTLPTDQFIFATISWNKKQGINIPSATFSLVKPAKFPKSEFERITEHYRRLELFQRYKRRTYSCYYNFYSASRIAHSTIPAVIKANLQRLIDIRRSNHGNNDWQVVLMDKLINDPTFIAECAKL